MVFKLVLVLSTPNTLLSLENNERRKNMSTFSAFENNSVTNKNELPLQKRVLLPRLPASLLYATLGHPNNNIHE